MKNILDISIPMLLKIKELIVDPGYEKLLRHLPVIDRAAITFFDAEMRDFLTPKLLTQVRAWLLRHLDNAFANKFNRRAADEPRRFEDYKRYWNYLKMQKMRSKGVYADKLRYTE